MRITALFPTLLAALACGVAAKNFTDASPFELVVLSKNHTLNGSRFDACHTGAAETTLCLLNLPAPSSPVPTGYAGVRPLLIIVISRLTDIVGLLLQHLGLSVTTIHRGLHKQPAPCRKLNGAVSADVQI